jgi:ribose/xylose/arabinose/galactoside ABC-type transport system permease subunit
MTEKSMTEKAKTPKSTDKPYGRKIDVAQLLLRGRAFIALILVIIVFSLISPTYLSPQNLEIMSKHVAIWAILAIGQTFVILTGGIDLGVGSIVGLTAMIAGAMVNVGIQIPQLGVVIYPHTWTILLISLVAGALMGSISGLIITRFGVAPFIATLGMLNIARGLAGIINNGYTYPNLVGNAQFGNTGFDILGATRFLGLNYSIWIMGLFGVIGYFIATRLPFGRHVYAIGGNENSAQLSGVRVKYTKIIVYMISGLCSAMVGLIIASQLVAAHPATGEGYELTSIAAVVLGGTSLAGGRGGIGGTLIGAFVIGLLEDGLVMVGVSSFWQMVVIGAVIVLAVIIDQGTYAMQERIARQRQQESQ